MQLTSSLPECCVIPTTFLTWVLHPFSPWSNMQPMSSIPGCSAIPITINFGYYAYRSSTQLTSSLPGCCVARHSFIFRVLLCRLRRTLAGSESLPVSHSDSLLLTRVFLHPPLLPITPFPRNCLADEPMKLEFMCAIFSYWRYYWATHRQSHESDRVHVEDTRRHRYRCYMSPLFAVTMTRISHDFIFIRVCKLLT